MVSNAGDVLQRGELLHFTGYCRSAGGVRPAEPPLAAAVAAAIKLNFNCRIKYINAGYLNLPRMVS